MLNNNTISDFSLYIHIPWCLRKCPYCDFNSHTQKTSIPEKLYLERLLQDLDEMLPLVQNRKLKSIFFGGGTPSLLSADTVSQLLNEIMQRFSYHNTLEISLEANPGVIDKEHFAGYKQAGITRISLGVQSFQSHHLQQLGRIHSAQDAYDAIQLIQKINFASFNIDLMYGLPKQNLEEVILDLKTALKFNPFHLSWYQLTLEPNTVFYRTRPILPGDNLIEKFENYGKSILLGHGLQQYEVSAFSQPSYECLHNINYWEYGDYIGIGAGAHSKITLNSPFRILRISKVRQPKTYIERSKSFNAQYYTVNSNEVIFEFMLNNLRLMKPISFKSFESRTGHSLSDCLEFFEKAENQGLLNITNDIFYPSSLGKKFLNDLIEIFLPA